jgi:hypothetical protein
VRHFTPDEANALIPMLIPLLEDLRQVNERRMLAVQEVQAFEMRAQQNGHGENTNVFSPEYDLRKIHEEMAERLRYLQELGVHLKDIENGIVDFPTRMGGRDVYLCWRLGEERVSHWHDMESGYAGRQPL